MRLSSRWRTASMVAGALFIGSVIGTPLAQAVSAGLVRIEGGHNANLAAVSKTGQLSVNAGLATTAAGQVKSALASPADTVAVSGPVRVFCNPGGIYKIPVGKALIITGATLRAIAATPGTFHGLALTAGPAASPCNFVLAALDAPSSEDQVSQNQVFSPGIPVPAGDAIALTGSGDVGAVLVYGYLVPAAAVPPGILAHTAASRGLMAIKPGT